MRALVNVAGATRYLANHVQIISKNVASHADIANNQISTLTRRRRAVVGRQFRRRWQAARDICFIAEVNHFTCNVASGDRHSATTA